MHINQLGNGTVKYIIFNDLLSNYKSILFSHTGCPITLPRSADITYIRRDLNKENGKLYKKGNC